jgi:ribosome-binding factor A
MNRIDRVNHELQKLIADAINNDLNDPRITGLISVLRVETTNDLSYAKVYVSILTADDKVQEVFNAIKSAGNYIRNLVKTGLKIREMPELIFKLDESITYSMTINKKLKEIQEKDEELKKNSIKKDDIVKDDKDN